MKVIIVDCFDSFTYNLTQLVGTLGAAPVAITCDNPLRRIEEENPDRIILSPGPGTPDDSGICPDVIRRYAGVVPILGVCLGHQTIASTFGGNIVRLAEPVHGKTSRIIHTGTGIFSGVENPFIATRYHSLTVRPNSVPSDFEVTATSAGDGCIMAISHRKFPVYGVQFHPESIMTPSGRQIMTNFLRNGELA
ncbi:MAG TPA: aminodeoxychorismate/anthranilate synthase component II [Methanospirillum sp.]|nr:aminodeoxychorismate/anthranilate synthase component II [Methanospirillum sp.]